MARTGKPITVIHKSNRMPPIKIQIFSDFACPFCYIGKGIIEELKKEFPIQDEWFPYELHPETPEQGVLIKDVAPDIDPDFFFMELNMQGKPFGVRFGTPTMVSNSRTALEAGEFAKEYGLFGPFHSAVFKASFLDCRDIGDRDVLMDVASGVGLDTDLLGTALEQGTYSERLAAAREQAGKLEVRAAPTFFIENGRKLTGALPLPIFQEALNEVSAD